MSLLPLPELTVLPDLNARRRLCPDVPKPTRIEPRPTPKQPDEPAAPSEGVQLIVAVVEGMAGRRALHQVGQWLSASAFNVVTRMQQSGQLRSGRIGSIRTQMPCPGAVEAAVRVLIDGRSTACAIRLDQHGRRWVCTDVRIAA